ncbi:hypothetical protein [Stieleria tagensis]|uniref:hypothetical protein n=1 Tax=Stieleria tagensis TaxID=2956795 RepID=UPI00209B4D6D|nr:hypothetical protein [Stieleria tagensis]
MCSFVLAASIALLWIPASSLCAQDGSEDQLGKPQLEKWSQYYLQRAEDYSLQRADDGKPLVLNPKPLMRWTNLVVSSDITHGECFVWTVDGRPEAFASLFSYNFNGQRRVAHAWNTFSGHPLIASFAGRSFWTPEAVAGDQRSDIAKSGAPAETRAKRLIQMRRLARQFTARSGGTNGDKELELRLLATPLFRYQGESDESIDGALFTFVTGTDPELLLLIEARQVDATSQWQFTALRHSHLTLRLWHDGELVWESLRDNYRNSGVPSGQQPYCSQHGVDLQPLLLP